MRCGFFTYSLRRAFANVRFVITNRPGRRFRDKHGGIPSCPPLKSSSPLSHDNRIAVIVILLFVVSSLSEWSRYCTVFARHVRRYNSRFLIGSVFVRFLFFPHSTLDPDHGAQIRPEPVERLIRRQGGGVDTETPADPAEERLRRTHF